VADGLVPLSVEIDAIDGLEVGPARWPAARRLDRLDANPLWVHEGVVRGTRPLTFTGAPGAADHVVGVTVAYQACDDATCLVPSALRCTTRPCARGCSSASRRSAPRSSARPAATLSTQVDYALPALVNDDQVTGALERAARRVIAMLSCGAIPSI
jgi:hypothetical protein